MAITCPNINTKEWKSLEEQVGTREAFRTYIAHNNDIPATQQPANIKKAIGFREVVPTKKAIGSVRSAMTHYNMENNTAHFIEADMVNRGYKLDLVLNYLPFAVFEQLKLDGKGISFISSKDSIKGAKSAELTVNFPTNPIDMESISTQLSEANAKLMEQGTPLVTRDRHTQQLYSLNSKDSVTASDELAHHLTETLRKHGVKVRTGIENLQTRKGMSADAIADLANDLILVSKGVKEADILPEEAAHFVIGTMDPDSELYKKLMKLVEHAPEYEKAKETHGAEYDNDVIAIKEEALGHILARQFVKEWNAQKVKTDDSSIVRLLKGLWQRIQRAMSRIVYGKYRTDLEKMLGSTAETFLNEKAPTQFADQTNRRQREMYGLLDNNKKYEAQGTETTPPVSGVPKESRDPGREADVQMEDNPKTTMDLIGQQREPLSEEDKTRIEAKLTKLLNNMIAQLDKRRKIVKGTSSRSKEDIKMEASRIGKLEKHLDEMAFLAGITTYLNQAKVDIYGRVVKQKGKHKLLSKDKHIQGALQALQDIQMQMNEGTIQDVNELARKLKDIHGFIVSYRDNVNAIIADMKDLKLYDQKDAFIIEIESLASEVVAKINEVETLYYSIGADMFGRFLGNYLGNRNKTEEMEKLDIMAALKQAEKDIGFFQLWANAMAESGDDILKLIDSAVKTAKYTGQTDARDDQQDLKQAQEDLEKAGYKDTSFVYDRDENGKITGNLVSQYGVSYDAWFKAHKEFMESLGPFPQREDYETEAAFTTALSDRTAKIDKWFEENTEVVPDAKEIKEKKKEELDNFNYQIWYDMNFAKTPEGPVLTRRSELRMPKKSKYADTSYTKLSTAQKKFLDEVWEVKRRNDMKMNPKFVRPQQAPMIRKDMVETMKHARSAADAKKGLKRIKEHFVRTEDDTGYGGTGTPENVNEEGTTVEEGPKGESIFTDVRGRTVRFLPVFFTKRLKDMSDLSLDIVATMSAHSAMANDYYQMNNIIHLLEVGKDYIFDKRGVPIKPNLFEALTGRRNEKGEKIKELANKEQGMSNIANRLKGYFDMQVYGHYKSDEGSIMGLDTAKLVDAMGSYVAINNLALNVYAGFANVIFGTANIRIEAAAGQFFDHKNLAVADKYYTRDLPGMLGDIGVRNKKSKLALWTEYFDTLQGFEEDVASMNATRHTRMSQLATTSSLFFMNHMGEHYMQTRTSLALADTIKLKDKKGNEVNLYDAMEVKGNKLVIKKEFEKQFTTNDLVKFRKKQNGINQSLHGIYNRLDKSYMQQRSYLRLVMMFRKFLIPALNRRFARKTYNYSIDAVTEGYYRAAGNFMVGLYKDAKAGQFSIVKNWNALTQREKQNFMRTFYEVAYVLAFLTLSQILIALAGEADDDEAWALNMAAYQSRRVFMEFAAYVPLPGFMPTEGLKIIKSPAAAVNQITNLNNTITYMMPWHWEEEMKTGQYKGWKKWQRYGVDALPLHRTIKGWMTPEEKLKYFSKPVF